MTQSWDTEAYSQNGSFVYELASAVLDWLAAMPDERILDIGCGDGHLTRRIADSGAAVVGLDASTEMAAAARNLGIEAVEGNAEALPFAAQSFDAVFSNAALHWVRDQDAMIGEVRRVLKPNGRFVAEMGGHGNIAAIQVALRAVLEKYGYGDREEGVNYFPSPEVYTRRLTRHGFYVERMELIPRPTRLTDTGADGWLRTFRRGVLSGLPTELRETVVKETAALLTPVLRDEDGRWIADYVRLRFIARAD